MEKRDERVTKVSFGKSGAGSRTTKLIIPVTWIDEMGITPDDREVNIKLKKRGKKTIIEIEKRA